MGAKFIIIIITNAVEEMETDRLKLGWFFVKQFDVSETMSQCGCHLGWKTSHVRAMQDTGCPSSRENALGINNFHFS